MKSIGIDSGASFTRIWDGESEVVKLKTPRSYTQYLQLLHKMLKGYEPMQSLVVALPAIVKAQQIVRVPNLGEDWKGKNVEADIRSLLQVAGKILVLQDTDAAGFAISKEELDGIEPTMLITLSTGVGGALITRNCVMPLEIGHMALNLSGNNLKCSCGQFGCAEADLSGTSIYQYMGVRPENLDNPEFWSNYGEELGKFFMILIALFKLKQIILIGGVSQRQHLFLERTNRYLESNLKFVPIPIIRVSRLGDNTGVYGAHLLATNQASGTCFSQS